MRRRYWPLKLRPAPWLGAFKFFGQLDNAHNQFVHPNGRLGRFVEITEGFSLAVDGLDGFDELVVVVPHGLKLAE